jgi:hypothetical protein
VSRIPFLRISFLRISFLPSLLKLFEGFGSWEDSALIPSAKFLYWLVSQATKHIWGFIVHGMALIYMSSSLTRSADLNSSGYLIYMIEDLRNPSLSFLQCDTDPNQQHVLGSKSSQSSLYLEHWNQLIEMDAWHREKSEERVTKLIDNLRLQVLLGLIL